MPDYPVHWNQPFPEDCRGGALTIGNFDGVHRGHQALLAELARQARVVHGPAVAMTFDPPPVHILRPTSITAPLTTLSDRTQLMRAAGADHVVVLATTSELLGLSARQFFDGAIRSGLAARAVVPGFNFAFGHNREGTAAVLAEMCQGADIACVPVPPLLDDGKAVSSSRIRGELLAGNVVVAAQLLGRHYRLTGKVAVGQRRGQVLGFPTANLEGVPTVVPGNGVYAVRAFHTDRTWVGAANIGPNPTFGEQDRKIEVHLIDFSGDLYGEVLVVEFLERLRQTTQFASVEDLKMQLSADIAAARQIGDNG
jgi:riboflavin kinase/FMN adenylyltransferase